MDFRGQIALAEDGEFQARVRQAMVTAAVHLMGRRPENTPGAIALHAKQTALAHAILVDPLAKQRAWAYVVVANPQISAQSADADIQRTVNAIWNEMAGVVLEPSAT